MKDIICGRNWHSQIVLDTLTGHFQLYVKQWDKWWDTWSPDVFNLEGNIKL